MADQRIGESAAGGRGSRNAAHATAGSPRVRQYDIDTALRLPAARDEWQGSESSLDLSVVIPACNEEQNVEPLWEELRGVLAATNLTFEVIIVDDGSTDATFEKLKAMTADPRLC